MGQQNSIKNTFVSSMKFILTENSLRAEIRMQILAENKQFQRLVSSRDHINMRKADQGKTDQEADKVKVTESGSDCANPIEITNNLEELIKAKDEEIERLSSLLSHLTTSSVKKPPKAQHTPSLTQTVAPLMEQITQLKNQNNSVKIKQALFIQVNERQFREIKSLEEEKRLMIDRLRQMEEDMKGEVEAREMKMAELRMELIQERRTRLGLEKELKWLKDVVREFEEQQEQQMENHQTGEKCCYCCRDKVENSLNQLSLHDKHTAKSCLVSICKNYAFHQSEPSPLSSELQNFQESQKLQESIMFM